MPTRANYYFAGWVGSNGDSLQRSVTIPKGSTGNKTYTANWTVITYTITYNYNGGSASNPLSYTIETTTFSLKNPTRTGYTFKSWSGSGSGTSISIPKGSTGNKSYTASWTANKYTISYNFNGKKNYFVNGTISKSNFSGANNDCLQIGYFVPSNFKLNDSVTFSANLTITAIFSFTNFSASSILEKKNIIAISAPFTA